MPARRTKHTARARAERHQAAYDALIAAMAAWGNNRHDADLAKALAADALAAFDRYCEVVMEGEGP